LREAKSMALRCVSHILPGVVQSLQVQREAKGASLCTSMVDMSVLTGDGLLLCLLGGWLLRPSDDAFHAVRHGCQGVREMCGGCEGGAGGKCERAAGADGGCGVGGVVRFWRQARWSCHCSIDVVDD
jgi:hypothetical protein